MKRQTINILLCATIALAAVSCAPQVQVTSDYDHNANFRSYKTFSMYKLTNSPKVNELNATRIERSIRAEMIRRGLVEVQSNPDLLVNAVTVIKNRTSYSASTTSYGYGGIYRPYGYWGGFGGLGSSYTTVQSHNYKDGTLIIDVIDAKTQRMIWHGTGSGEMRNQPKDPEALITETVKKIMAAFPDYNAKS